ncbi:hypothetical protein AB0G04_29470 [Actinoplanes sp. NPDC023801]|uniref:hypothetical protein n=1 Tax=Actinoplanes sp. NPDC023801 TaxID=3154595 RepID=UPI0033E20FF5
MRKDLLLMLALGLLAAPRAVLHDLGLIHEGTGAQRPVRLRAAADLGRGGGDAFAGSGPVAARCGPGVYGICLAVVHNLLWNGETTVAEPVARIAMVLSSLGTGLAVGALCGGLAWLIVRSRSGPADRNQAAHGGPAARR